jgi:hypothetical protein
MALLSLFEEGTAKDDELVVELDSLSHGKANNKSMEDSAADSDAADGNAADIDATSRDLTMNGLRQMGQRLHQYDILKLFSNYHVGNIEWGGVEYEDDMSCPIL